jgi:hypothetical protein
MVDGTVCERREDNGSGKGVGTGCSDAFRTFRRGDEKCAVGAKRRD